MTPPSEVDSLSAAPGADCRVSIAVPVHNGAHHLAETLTSILEQTHAALEIVVIDDNSSDGSVEVAERFAQRDSRVNVLHNELNLGMVGNWNRAVSVCSGRWIHLTGQDDLLAPTAIEIMLSAVTDESRLVMAARRFSFEANCPRPLRRAYTWELPTLETLGVPSGVVTPAAAARLVSRLPSPCTNFLGEPVCGLIRHDIFKDRGPFNEGLSQLADYEFWLRCVLQEPFVHVAQPLFRFRVHGGSATQTNLADRVQGVHLEYARLLLELLEGERFSEARQLHPALVELWEESLLNEVVILQKFARCDAQAAATIQDAAGGHPGLARRINQPVSLQQRLQNILAAARIQIRRLGSASLGRHLGPRAGR
ncbi:MAG: glycosyltransferase [Lentisphaerae bacterium]|nr:glycosyltransferase [Lentisphaerota bacterium]